MQPGTSELLELNEWTSPEVERVQENGAILYLFQLEEFLPPGQYLAIDGERRIIGISHEQKYQIVDEILMEREEIAIFPSLLPPHRVDNDFMKTIWMLSTKGEESMFSNVIFSLTNTCDKKLRTLHLAMAFLENEYCLTTVNG